MIILFNGMNFNETFIIIGILCIVYQGFIKLYIYPSAFTDLQNQNQNREELPVTILLCAHQAAKLLQQNLISILNQDYSQFEVLVVNDGEDIETTQIIQSFQLTYRHLNLLENPKNSIGKKDALIHGIKKCNFSWILLTDADCKPNSPNWLRKMMNSRRLNSTIVLGFAPYLRSSGFLNGFIRFETVLNGIQYLSSAASHFPYMGVGRNLLYHKSIFNEKLIRTDMPFGDDDLLINHSAHSLNTTICLDPDTFVYSEAKNSWRAYFRQRKRHFSTARYYSFNSKIYLALLSLSLFLFYTSVALLLWNVKFISAFTLWLPWTLINWFSARKTFSKLNAKDLINLYPIFELSYLLFILTQFPFILLKKAQESWN